MINEIGSEFWAQKRDSTGIKSDIPIWLKKYGDVVLTSSGRGALSLILDKIKSNALFIFS